MKRTNRTLLVYSIIYTVAGILLYFSPMKTLTRLSFHSELYSHILLIPVISGYFLVTDRKRIFKDVGYAPGVGLSLTGFGLFSYMAAMIWNKNLSQSDFLFFCMIGMVTWMIGGFITFYGKKAFKRAMFPLVFLVFMIPIPVIVLDPIIRVLQVGSAHTAEILFNVIGIPFYRDGMMFEFTGVTVEVAKQCSGIRSSLALFITSVIVGYMFLKPGWRRIVLTLAIFPITIFKNAVRITTITSLSLYVDITFLTDSWLHKSGGIVFFALALVLLAPIVWFLKQSEKKHAAKGNNIPEASIRG